MCNEVSDRSNQELLNIVIRYVSTDGRVHEELIALISVPNTSAFCLYDVIIAKLNDLSLSLNHLIGQCFDGASNMAGQYNGVQARLKEVCVKKPIYVHCWTRVLNLTANDIVKLVPQCNKVFDSSQKLYVHIEGLPKRQSEYMLCISDLNLDDGIKVLQSLSSTR